MIHRKPPQEKTLRSEDFTVGHKTFLLALKENHRGRFVRITEQTGKNHSTIIIPDEGLATFAAKLSTLRTAGEQPPPPPAIPPASSAP